MVVFVTWILQNMTTSELAHAQENNRNAEKEPTDDVYVNTKYPSLYFFNVEQDFTKQRVEYEILGTTAFIDFVGDGDVMFTSTTTEIMRV